MYDESSFSKFKKMCWEKSYCNNIQKSIYKKRKNLLKIDKLKNKVYDCIFNNISLKSLYFVLVIILRRIFKFYMLCNIFNLLVKSFVCSKHQVKVSL